VPIIARIVPATPTQTARQPEPSEAARPGAAPSSRLGTLLRWTIILSVWGGLAGFLLLLWFAHDLPRPEEALQAVRRPSLVLTDSAGRAIATYGDVVGEPLHLAQVPPFLPQAAVAVEDRRFWSHGGIDLWGMARAALVDLVHGHVVQGGSTITQQVAKTLFLSNARTIRRKVQELLLTLWLERHFSKAEILEIWLNRVYLGSGAWGVDGAARLYFGISARHLTLWQAAVLAGLPRAPSRFNPRSDPEAAAARGREVLAAMVQQGSITAAQAAQAAAEMRFPPHPASGGWFADWAAEQATEALPEGQDAFVATTLDSALQARMQARLTAMLDHQGAAVGAGQGAAVAIEATSGAVRAMVGGRDWQAGQYNRAVLARRQPGSAFKPFVWLAALEAGVRPDDAIADTRLTVGGWSPEDDDRHYLGEISVEHALAVSSNVASVRLLLRAGGPGKVAAVAHRLGIADALPNNDTLALGTGDVGLLELAAAYAPFCNGGYAVAPHGVARLRAGGTPEPPPPPHQVVDGALAGMMVRMMAAVVRDGTGRAAALPGRLVIGKTGTTQDSRDAWFIGCTGGLVIGVWMGNDDGHPMKGVTGGSLPATLFREIAE
jgi:penicillin-binding protein 1A